jgi:hypothetical protein
MPDIVAPVIPNIRADPTIFLSAFQTALANRRKQQQLELAITRMQQQAEIADAKLELQSKFGEWRHEKDLESLQQGQERLGDMERFHAMESTVRTNEENRKLNAYEDKLKTAEANSSTLADFQKELSNIDAEQGTQEWEHQANLIRSKYGSPTWTPAGERIWKDAFTGHKSASTERMKADNQVKVDYYKNLSSNQIPEKWLSDPEEWGKNKDGSRFVAYDDQGRRVPPNTPGAHFKTITGSDYETIRQQRSRVQEIESSNRTRAATQSTVETAPTDPSKRIANTVYKTPKGLFKWTGTEWAMP